jgi:DNA-directed RNA polymerase subunit K/omega
LSVNVDNGKLTDEAFREFVRNSLPIVIFERINKT